MRISTECSAIVLSILSIVSIIWTYEFFVFIRNLTFNDLNPTQSREKLRKHSWEIHDISEKLSMPSLNPAEMTVEESIHFPLNNFSIAESEWASAEPYGRGVARLGPDQFAYLVSLYHELHCLHYIGAEIINGTKAHWPHIQHCLNLLREWTLCDADVTLEPGDFTKRNFTTDRLGETHTCRNWEAVYEEMKDNWVDWYKFRVKHDIMQVKNSTN